MNLPKRSTNAWALSAAARDTIREMLLDYLQLTRSILPDVTWKPQSLQAKKIFCFELYEYPISPQEAWKKLPMLVRGVYSALEELHSKQWAHCDVRLATSASGRKVIC